MARDQIGEIKEKIDIVALISSYVSLTKAGRHYKGLCPFHSEKTPSFIVSAELQIFKCFGCGESGDVFSFLEKYEGMEFYEALKFLAEKAGVKLERREAGIVSDKEKVYKINELASKFYQFLLLNHPVGKKALAYLTEKREINEKSLKTFMVGFAPQGRVLSEFLIKRKKLDVSDIEKTGLLISGRSGFFDRFGGRVIFPINDLRGNFIGLSGRILPEYDNGRMGKYINSPETIAYHKSSSLYGVNITKNDIRKAKCAIVTEGELDLISLWQRGITNVVAIKGSALTVEQGKILARMGNEVILALDSDWAGNEAAMRGIKAITETGVDIKVARFSKYKDPDEAARGDIAYFKRSLTKAYGVWDFVIGLAFESTEFQSGSGKSKLSRKIVPILSEISDKIVQDHYVRKVSEKLGVSEESVFEQIENYEKSKTVKSIENTTKKEVEEMRDILERRLLRIYINHDPKLILTGDIRELFKKPLHIQIIGEIEGYLKKNKKFEIMPFSMNLPTELFEGFSNIILTASAEKESLKDSKSIVLEIVKLELRDLQKLISKLEKTDDEKVKSEALEKYALLTKKYSALDLG
ncbi:DNA primase [Candidatus Woesebacteria bacterium]|nr:DNA primase [Candidatus Woesebacteria bacterium]